MLRLANDPARDVGTDDFVLLDDIVDQIALIADGNPRRIIETARQALTMAASESSSEGVHEEFLEALRQAQHRRRRDLDELGRPAAMLYAEIESLGPVSASDQRLLARMGWTRSRAVQVFAQLEEAGLVVSQSVRGPDGGRPRKEYSVAPVEISDEEPSHETGSVNLSRTIARDQA